MIDLLPDADQQEIADNVAAFLNDKLPVERHRRDRGRRGEHEFALWKELAEIGCFGMTLPETAGGVGLTLAEETLAFREYGRHLVSPSMLATVLAARVAQHAGCADIVATLIEGSKRVALAAAVEGTAGATATGEFHVFDAAEAAFVLAWDDGGAALFDAAAFAGARTVDALDGSVSLGVAKLAGAKALAFVPASAAPIPTVATVLTAAMLVGINEAVRDMAVEQGKARQQFGVPIGSFQAIKHRCADMALVAEAAWSQVCYAALSIRGGNPDADFQAVTAKIVAANSALESAAQNIQVHGGMGFTAELNAHLFLKRVHLLNLLGGDARALQQKLLTMKAPA